MDKKFIYAIISLGLSGAMLLGYGLILITEQPPIWYPNEPFMVYGQPVEAGEEFTFDISRCAKYDTSYVFTQEWVDLEGNVVVPLPGDTVKADKGCVDIFSTPKEVPNYLPPGEYRLRFTVVSRGVLRNHTTHHVTQVIVVE